jgi:hypothetical protein
VIFYDTDWNPQMDRQAQDRCHRIGQTRNVRIYRLICESTIEENILLKSLQRKRVGEMVTENGMFTVANLKTSYREILQDALQEAGPDHLRQYEDEEDQLEHSQQAEERFAEEELPPIVRYGLRVLRGRLDAFGEDPDDQPLPSHSEDQRLSEEEEAVGDEEEGEEEEEGEGES